MTAASHSIRNQPAALRREGQRSGLSVTGNDVALRVHKRTDRVSVSNGALHIDSGQRSARLAEALLFRSCPRTGSSTRSAAACAHASFAPSRSGWNPMPTGKEGDTSSAAQLAFTSATARAQIAEAQVVGRAMLLAPQCSPSWVQHTPCANTKALCS